MTTRTSYADQDLYGVLEVTPTASAEVVEAAYKTLMKRFHPDRADSDTQRELFNRKAVELNVARDVLADPAARARYDRERMAARPSTVAPPWDATAATPGNTPSRPAPRAAPQATASAEPAAPPATGFRLPRRPSWREDPVGAAIWTALAALGTWTALWLVGSVLVALAQAVIG